MRLQTAMLPYTNKQHTCAMCSTRAVWPVSSAILAMLGYFHRHSWFLLKPWLDTISRSWRLHCSAQTCWKVAGRGLQQGERAAHKGRPAVKCNTSAARGRQRSGRVFFVACH